MRLSIRVRIDSGGKAGLLPLDYRQGFASLLKAALKRYDPAYYRLLYGRSSNGLKGFTFAVYFPQLDGKAPIEPGEKAEQRYLRVGSQAWWNLSFADLELAALVANAFLLWMGRKPSRRLPQEGGGGIPAEQPPIHTWRKRWEFSVEEIRLLPLRQVRSDRVRVRTLSPFLVNPRGASHTYLTPVDGNFQPSLEFLIEELSRSFLRRRLRLAWGECDFSSLRRLPVWHYGQYMTANQGTFTLAGPPKLLHLLYQAGLGARRSQGFGMLEIVEEG